MSVSSFKGPGTTIIRVHGRDATAPTPAPRPVPASIPPAKAPRRSPAARLPNANGAHDGDKMQPTSNQAESNRCAYVEVLFDFDYETEYGRKVYMHKGERFVLLKKMNDDWYQVMRLTSDNGSKTPVDDYDDDLLLDNEEERSASRLKKQRKNARNGHHGKSSSIGSIDVSSGDELDAEDEADYVNSPFYAPASYLREVADVGSATTSVLLSGSMSCDDSCEDVDSGNLEDAEVESSNTAATSSRESLLVDEPLTEIETTTTSSGVKPATPPRDYDSSSPSPNGRSIDCDNNNDLKSDKSKIGSSARSKSPPKPRIGRPSTPPDYANLKDLPILPVAVKKKNGLNAATAGTRNDSTPTPAERKASTPPAPTPGLSPVRILLDHWAEYVDASGRRFYYNSVTRESSWKPPRRRPSFLNSCEDLTAADDELSGTHSDENLPSCDSAVGHSTTTPSSGNELFKDMAPSSGSLPCRPKPKTKPRKLLTAQLYTPPTLTKGMCVRHVVCISFSSWRSRSPPRALALV